MHGLSDIVLLSVDYFDESFASPTEIQENTFQNTNPKPVFSMLYSKHLKRSLNLKKTNYNTGLTCQRLMFRYKMSDEPVLIYMYVKKKQKKKKKKTIRQHTFNISFAKNVFINYVSVYHMTKHCNFNTEI